MNGDGGKNGIIAPWVRMGVDAEMAGHVRSRRDILSKRISRGGRRKMRGGVSGTSEVGEPGVAPSYGDVVQEKATQVGKTRSDLSVKKTTCCWVEN